MSKVKYAVVISPQLHLHLLEDGSVAWVEIPLPTFIDSPDPWARIKHRPRRWWHFWRWS